MNIETYIKKKVREIGNLDETIIVTDHTNLFDDLDFDSMMLIQLICDIEEQFDFDADADDYLISFDNFEMIGALTKKVQEILSEETGSEPDNK